MRELLTEARPYAKALFDLAVKRGQTSEWSIMLERLSAIVSHPRVRRWIHHPKIDGVEFSRALSKGDDLMRGPMVVSLIGLLMRKRRLELLPYIRDQFEQQCREHGGYLKAILWSAFTLDKDEIMGLMNVLSRRLDKKIQYEVVIDPEMIGGVVVHVGDWIADLSLNQYVDRIVRRLRNVDPISCR